jgi:CHAT domain-containing protein
MRGFFGEPEEMKITLEPLYKWLFDEVEKTESQLQIQAMSFCMD